MTVFIGEDQYNILQWDSRDRPLLLSRWDEASSRKVVLRLDSEETGDVRRRLIVHLCELHTVGPPRRDS